MSDYERYKAYAEGRAIAPAGEDEKPSMVGTALRGARRALTFNYDDELADLLHGMGMLPDSMSGAEIKRANQLDREYNPNTALLSELATGIGTAFIPGVGPARLAANAGRGARAIGTILSPGAAVAAPVARALGVGGQVAEGASAGTRALQAGRNILGTAAAGAAGGLAQGAISGSGLGDEIPQVAPEGEEPMNPRVHGAIEGGVSGAQWGGLLAPAVAGGARLIQGGRAAAGALPDKLASGSDALADILSATGPRGRAVAAMLKKAAAKPEGQASPSPVLPGYEGPQGTVAEGRPIDLQPRVPRPSEDMTPQAAYLPEEHLGLNPKSFYEGEAPPVGDIDEARLINRALSQPSHLPEGYSGRRTVDFTGGRPPATTGLPAAARASGTENAYDKVVAAIGKEAFDALSPQQQAQIMLAVEREQTVPGILLGERTQVTNPSQPSASSVPPPQQPDVTRAMRPSGKKALPSEFSEQSDVFAQGQEAAQARGDIAAARAAGVKPQRTITQQNELDELLRVSAEEVNKHARAPRVTVAEEPAAVAGDRKPAIMAPRALIDQVKKRYGPARWNRLSEEEQQRLIALALKKQNKEAPVERSTGRKKKR